MKKGDLLKKIISFSRLLPVVLFFFTGCEQLTWDAPVHEFFEYYTSTAAIVDCVINRSIGSGSVGIECVESSDKQSVSLLLRNPQRYKLDFTYNFDSSLVASKASSFSSPVTFVQSDSRDSVTIYFSKDFLYSIDNGDACSTDSLGNTTAISKDLSGTIIIKEAATQREFESFHVSVMVNSIPPRIRGAMYQTTAASGGGTEYVICFYVPNLTGTVHENDTKKIYVGGDLYNLEFTGSGVNITKSGGGTSRLTTSLSTTLKNVDASTAVFSVTPPTSYITLYYLTGLDPSAQENATVSSSLSLTDDYGFSNTVYISNTNPQLTPVTLSVTDGETYSVEDDTGLFTFTINHDRKAYRTLKDESDPTGQSTHQVPAEDAPGAPTIIYNIFKVGSSTPIFTGKGTAPVSISVEKGNFFVEAYACYSGYVDSGNNTGFGSSAQPFSVHRSTNYYVNASGSASGNGSINNPYNSLQKCVQEMISDASNDYVPGATYTVKLQSNIRAISTDVFDSTTDKAFALFKKPSGVSDSTIKFKIDGNGYTIDAGLSSGAGCVIKTQPNVNLTINNVTITGGYDGDAGGIYISGSTVTLNGVTVTGNYAAAGAGIVLHTGTLNLNGVTITGNTGYDWYDPTLPGSDLISSVGVLYNDGTVNISGRNIISGNYTTANRPSNFYIYKDSPLNITGDITGSLIRVAKDFKGAPPVVGEPVTFTSGYDYGTKNTEPPGRIFKGDSYAVVKEGDEAAFAESGATIYNAFDFNFDFTMSPSESDGKYKFTSGQAKTFTVMPVVKVGNDTTELTYVSASRTLQNETTGARYYDANGVESQITWSAKLMCGGELKGTYAPTVNNNAITLNPNLNLYPEVYTLHVTATYMGVSHSKDFIIYGESH